MTADGIVSAVVGLLRRQWWLALLCAFAAALVGYLLGSGATTTYVATATISVDASALQRVAGLPGTEQLLREARTQGFYEAAAARTGLTAAEIASGIRTYSVGSPATAFMVEFTSTDADEAKRVAEELAQLVYETEQRLGGPELNRQRTLVKECEDTLAQVGTLADLSDWERLDVTMRISGLKRELANYQAILATLDGVYEVQKGTTLVTHGATAQRSSDALGAAVLGLAIGVALGIIRERMRLSRVA